MLLVETYLSQSPRHGIGLYASKRIPKGTKIWEFTPGFDLELSVQDLAILSKPCLKRVLEYAYFNASKARYILCSDDARFINHSETPNTTDVGFGGLSEGETFAAVDIPPYEEITSDYRSFEQADGAFMQQVAERGDKRG